MARSKDGRPAARADGRTVKTTITLDVESHRRLCVLATMRGVDRSALVAEILEPHLRGVVVQLRGAAADTPATLPIAEADAA